MNAKKIIVCNATGRQGEAVVRCLILDPKIIVVGLTRDTTSFKALQLKELGVEMVEADAGNLTSLLNAFKDAFGVFAITQPWNSKLNRYDSNKELRQGKNLIWAVKQTGIQHVIFSSFINPLGEITGASFLDNKLILESLFIQQGLPFTFLRCGLYMDNIEVPLETSHRIRGNYNANTPIPYISLRDIGSIVQMIFNNPSCFLNKIINAAGDYITGNEIADTLSEKSPSLRFSYKGDSWLLQFIFRHDIYNLRKFFTKLGKSEQAGLVRDAVQSLHEILPGTLSFTDFLAKERDNH